MGFKVKGIKTWKRDWRSPTKIGAWIAAGLSTTVLGSRKTTRIEDSFNAPPESCARRPAACWTAIKTSGEGTQILGLALRVVWRGREEGDLRIRRR